MKCQRCGHPMKFGEEKCKKCGTKIKKDEEYLRMEKEKEKNQKKDQIAVIFSACVLVFILIFGLYVIFFK
ncbi:hypothetical protein [Peptacetobacter sp.]|uniref:hypothetical protein n=1 Tax=Peptacetobacter sp. TaxID=2991975 RepID=UPI00263033BC|nr:hypothetical protein [Peptacetobacter sp.]